MQTKNKKSLAILVPMFNEEKVAALCIDTIMEVLKNINCEVKLFVVNDGSFDNTETILKEKNKTYKKNLIIISHKKNKGYGAALQTGITAAQKSGYTWILHMDSDLTNDPKYIHEFVHYMDSSYDCIKASRYMKGGKVEQVSFFRKIISIIGNYVASLLFHVGIKDCTNGFRMVRLSLLQDVKFRENNFSIIFEELLYLKKQGAKFTEIPYTLTARKNSQSHFSYKPKVFFSYLKYAVRGFFS